MPVRSDSTSPTGDTVTLAGVTYCGYHACPGSCGLPAGYVDRDGRRWFLRGATTALGQVMQRDQHRDGATVDLGAVVDAETIERLFARWWR